MSTSVNENDSSPKRTSRPSLALYRPGMLKTGTDITGNLRSQRNRVLKNEKNQPGIF